jgi:hypothetical protein
MTPGDTKRFTTEDTESTERKTEERDEGENWKRGRRELEERKERTGREEGENWKRGRRELEERNYKNYKSFYYLLFLGLLLSSSVFFSVLSVSSVVNLSSPPFLLGLLLRALRVLRGESLFPSGVKFTSR